MILKYWIHLSIVFDMRTWAVPGLIEVFWIEWIWKHHVEIQSHLCSHYMKVSGSQTIRAHSHLSCFCLNNALKGNWISRVVYSTLKNVGLISGISLSCFATQFIKGYWIRGLEKMFRVADGIFFCEIGLKNLPINIYSFKLSLIKPEQYWPSI